MTSNPVEPLPPGYKWGFVVGRSIHAIADTIEDPDRYPEARGSTGRVIFTPRLEFRRHLDPPTTFVHYETVSAQIRNGYVIDAHGLEGIYLIVGVYDVKFVIENGSIPGFPIEVTENHTKENPLDLVTAAPYVPGPSEPLNLIRVPTGPAQDQVLVWDEEGFKWDYPPVGPRGVEGPRGPQGNRGDSGPQGEEGPRGPRGEEGPQGDKGDTGDTGPRGPQGEQGLQGVQGPRGPQGDDGPKGDKGDQGDQGDVGSGLNVEGSLDSPDDLPETGEPGDGYFIDGDLWVWSGDAWENVGNIKGPEGPRGPEGPQGNTGPRGFQGDEGPQGVQGPKGDKGDTGDTGPRGETGPRGVEGPQGEEGPRGVQGPTGDQGEEGPKGEPGDRGPKGDKGDTGEQGPRGNTGPAGQTGQTGSRGLQGLQGETGPRGPQGEQGPQGVQGPQGETGPRGPAGDPGPRFRTYRMNVQLSNETASSNSMTIPLSHFGSGVVPSILAKVDLTSTLYWVTGCVITSSRVVHIYVRASSTRTQSVPVHIFAFDGPGV